MLSSSLFVLVQHLFYRTRFKMRWTSTKRRSTNVSHLSCESDAQQNWKIGKIGWFQGTFCRVRIGSSVKSFPEILRLYNPWCPLENKSGLALLQAKSLGLTKTNKWNKTDWLIDWLFLRSWFPILASSQIHPKMMRSTDYPFRCFNVSPHPHSLLKISR